MIIYTLVSYYCAKQYYLLYYYYANCVKMHEKKRVALEWYKTASHFWLVVGQIYGLQYAFS